MTATTYIKRHSRPRRSVAVELSWIIQFYRAQWSGRRAICRARDVREHAKDLENRLLHTAEFPAITVEAAGP